MQKKVQINNESIESIVRKDYKEALVDYILNAFEADATEVRIVSTKDKLGNVKEIKIIDNGIGIDHKNLSQTFESFLTSNKKPLLKPINLGKNKGKGCYSFISFANSATWETVYKDGEKLFAYSITIRASSKDYINFDTDVTDVTYSAISTGTTVILSGINSLSIGSMDLGQIEKPLLLAFASFLYLKKSRGFTITVDGKALHYEKLIDTEISRLLKKWCNKVANIC